METPLVNPVTATIDGNEAVARVAWELNPYSGTTAAAIYDSEAAGQLDKAARIRSMTMDAFLAALYQSELAHIPFPDEPPVVYPPAEVWQALTSRCSGHTGYTHQWRQSDALRGLCMASADSVEDARDAHAAGWRTFRVALPCDAPRIESESICPASVVAMPPVSRPPMALGWPVIENGQAPGLPIRPVARWALRITDPLATPWADWLAPMENRLTVFGVSANIR